jgi:hypothetical protein
VAVAVAVVVVVAAAAVVVVNATPHIFQLTKKSIRNSSNRRLKVPYSRSRRYAANSLVFVGEQNAFPPSSNSQPSHYTC